MNLYIGLILSISLGAQIRLTDQSTIALKKLRGNVMEVATLPDGSYLVRSFDVEDLDYQAVEVYKPNGDFQRAIGEKGWGPGKFYRLTGFDLGDNGSVYTLDVKGRISVFDPLGKLIRSLLAQAPLESATTYRASSTPDRYYIGGCIPNQTVRQACTLLHLFDGNRDTLIRSAIDYEPGFADNGLILFVYPRIAIDNVRKRVFLNEGPSTKLHWTSADLQKSGQMEIVSNIALAKMPKDVPRKISSSPRALDQMLREMTIFNALVISGDTLLLGLRSGLVFYGEVVDLKTMTQIATDVPLPGSPVGVDKSGRFIFASSSQNLSRKTWKLLLGRFSR